MNVLNEWWSKIDHAKKKFIPLTVFTDFLRSKKVIGRDSEMQRLIKNTIPTEVLVDESLKYTQFIKIFARACLRGAITNIYDYMKQTMKHEQGSETGEGQLLKVLKFQRSLIIGGLQAQHDVNGVDAVNMALQLEQQVKKHPEQFEPKFKEGVQHDTMMKYLTRER